MPPKVFPVLQLPKLPHPSKIYSVRLYVPKAVLDYEFAVKHGEYPAFGPPASKRLLTLLGTGRDTFLKGRRAETQGLGIGAFAYYRRVVENLKNTLIDEIIRVAQRVNSPALTIEALKSAREEFQFSNAVDSIKVAIPQSLLFDGQHNPLALLHRAPSVGIHDMTDEQCLKRAATIRIVLQDLAERMSSALKER